MNDDTESGKYTQEQKIIAAVWIHERFHNNQTWNDINRNFRARFNVQPPMRATFLNWERKLFSQGNVEDKEKCGRPLARLMHVPYVRASIEESPDLSLRERAKILGLPRTTLLKILREDLDMEFEVDETEQGAERNKRHAPYNNGKWKLKRTEQRVPGEPNTASEIDNNAASIQENHKEVPPLTLQKECDDVCINNTLVAAE